MEEARALVALEAHAQRLLQRRAHGLERRRIARRLDTGQPVARIGGEQPRQVFRFGKRRPVRQGAGEIFAQARAGRIGEGARLFQLAPEVFRAVRQPEGFELRGAAGCVFAQQHEVAQVRHQHEPVFAPIAADLRAVRGQPGVVVGRLDLDRAAFRRLALARPALLDLLRREEAEIRVARAPVGKVADAEHLRLERRAHRVQQVGERRVVRQLPGPAAGRADPRKIGKVSLDRLRRFLVRSRHGRSCGGARRRAQVSFCFAAQRRVAPAVAGG